MAKIAGFAGSTPSARTRARQQHLPEAQAEWPILEPLLEEDENAVLATVAGLDEGVKEAPRNQADDLTPDTLLGDHRDGHWASREDEDEGRGIN